MVYISSAMYILTPPNWDARFEKPPKNYDITIPAAAWSKEETSPWLEAASTNH